MYSRCVNIHQTRLVLSKPKEELTLCTCSTHTLRPKRGKCHDNPSTHLRENHDNQCPGTVGWGQRPIRANRACQERYPNRNGRKQYSGRVRWGQFPSRVGREQYPASAKEAVSSATCSATSEGDTVPASIGNIKSSIHSATPAGHTTSANICSSRSTGTEANRQHTEPRSPRPTPPKPVQAPTVFPRRLTQMNL